MNNFSWIILLYEFFYTLGAILALMAVIILVWVLANTLYVKDFNRSTYKKDRISQRVRLKYTLVLLALILILPSCVIPSKKVFYLILTSEYVEELNMDENVQTLIDNGYEYLLNQIQ